MESEGMMFSGAHTMPTAQKGFQFKICLFGGKNVGKTSMCVQYVESHFVESYYPTNVQNEFTKMLKYKNQDYTLEIVDTAGQNEDSMINMKSLNGCEGLLLCYSVVNRQSFELIPIIWDKIIDQLGKKDDIPVVVVATHIDIRDKSDCKLDKSSIVNKIEGEQLVKDLSDKLSRNKNRNKNGIKNTSETPQSIANLSHISNIGFIETSSKLNINVDEAILLLLKKMEYSATNGSLIDDTKCTLM